MISFFFATITFPFTEPIDLVYKNERRKIMSTIFQNKHVFIVEEKFVTTILTAINNSSSTFHKINNLIVSNCGWDGNNRTKWYISFYCTSKRYDKILKNICKTEGFNIVVLRGPSGKEDLYIVRAN